MERRLNNTTEIRNYVENDLQAVSDLICRCLLEVNSKDYPANVIEDLVQEFSTPNLSKRLSEMDRTIVLKHSNKILGTASIKDNNIHSVFVLPSQHKKGYGKKLMENLENFALKNKIDCIKLRSSLSSSKFYLKCGYVETERTTNKKAVEMISMMKQF